MHKIVRAAAVGMLVSALLAGSVSAATLETPQDGIDISHWNVGADFAEIKAAGKTFVYIKATEGITYNDSAYTSNRTGAAAAGLLWGAYHFMRFNVSPEAQAEHFWQIISGTGYTLRPVVDVEVADGVQKAADVRALLERFCARFAELSGMQPVIYSYTSYINEYGLAKEFSDRLLWQADYRSTRADTGWAAQVWQYSESGSVAGLGGNVDLNTMYDDAVLMPGASIGQATAGNAAASETKTGDATVLAHQRAWNSLRIYPSVSEDGVSGPQTRRATVSLQWLTGIAQDGVWGAQTQAAYQSITDKPTLRQGNTGAAVRYIQLRVGIAIDGKFGPATAAAVKAWQSAHGLSADGIVGPATWAALLGV